MENIAIRIRQSDPTAAAFEQENSAETAENQIKYGKLEQKVIDEMWKDMDEFEGQIEDRQNETKDGLHDYRDRMTAKLAKA